MRLWNEEVKETMKEVAIAEVVAKKDIRKQPTE